jgi:hypothetical protein
MMVVSGTRVQMCAAVASPDLWPSASAENAFSCIFIFEYLF